MMQLSMFHHTDPVYDFLYTEVSFIDAKYLKQHRIAIPHKKVYQLRMWEFPLGTVNLINSVDCNMGIIYPAPLLIDVCDYLQTYLEISYTNNSIIFDGIQFNGIKPLLTHVHYHCPSTFNSIINQE